MRATSRPDQAPGLLPRCAVRLLVLASLGCAAAGAPKAPSGGPVEVQRSRASEREHLALTVYDSNLALVREQRKIQLGRGRVALAYEDVSAQIQPATVQLRALGAPGDLFVLEQNYRYDLLTPEKLLERYVGQRVSLARYDRAAGVDVVREAEVLAAAKGPVLRVGGELIRSLPEERISFPQLPSGLAAKPTLVWLLDSAREEQRVEVSYLTQNLSWHADYVLSLAADDAHADLTGWVTLDNQTGTSFTAAELQLVAGAVRSAPPEPAAPRVRFSGPGQRLAASAPRAAPPFEVHEYGIQRPTDLLAREQKQLQLLEARGISVEKKLVLRSPPRALLRPGLPPARQQVSVVVVVGNLVAAGLGLPLPRGLVRVYRADAAGAQQFVGEDAIDHTPRDEKIEIELGNAFDVVAERRQLSQRQPARCVSQSEWQTELRNHKPVAVTVEVVESAGGDWQVVESTHPAEVRDARSFAFRVPVAARGSTELRYSLRVRTCGDLP